MSISSIFNIVGGMIGKSGETIAGAPSGNPIPAGTYTGDNATSTTYAAGEIVAYVSDEETNTDNIVTAFARVDFIIEKTATGMKVTVAAGAGNGGAGANTWYNQSRTPTTLTATPVTIYTNDNATFTAFKVEQTIDLAYGGVSSGTWDDNGGDYVSTPSTGSTVTYVRSCIAGENIIGSSTTNIVQAVISIYGRATSYDDTLLARFAFYLQADASRV